MGFPYCDSSRFRLCADFSFDVTIHLSVNPDRHRVQDQNPTPDPDPEAGLVAGRGLVQSPEADLVADHGLIQEGEGTSQDRIRHVEDRVRRQDIGHLVDADTHPLQENTHVLLQDHHAAGGKRLSFIFMLYLRV